MFVSVLRLAETARQLRGFHTPNVEKRGRQVELSCLGVLELRTGLGGVLTRTQLARIAGLG